MSNLTEGYEQDIAWLLERMPDASENTQDDFAERIAIMVCDGGVEIERARMLTLKRLEQKKWGSG